MTFNSRAGCILFAFFLVGGSQNYQIYMGFQKLKLKLKRKLSQNVLIIDSLPGEVPLDIIMCNWNE